MAGRGDGDHVGLESRLETVPVSEVRGLDGAVESVPDAEREAMDGFARALSRHDLRMTSEFGRVLDGDVSFHPSWMDRGTDLSGVVDAVRGFVHEWSPEQRYHVVEEVSGIMVAPLEARLSRVEAPFEGQEEVPFASAARQELAFNRDRIERGLLAGEAWMVDRALEVLRELDIQSGVALDEGPRGARVTRSRFES